MCRFTYGNQGLTKLHKQMQFSLKLRWIHTVFNNPVSSCLVFLPIGKMYFGTACCCFGSTSAVQLQSMVKLLCNTSSKRNVQAFVQNLPFAWSVTSCKLQNQCCYICYSLLSPYCVQASLLKSGHQLRLWVYCLGPHTYWHPGLHAIGYSKAFWQMTVSNGGMVVQTMSWLQAWVIMAKHQLLDTTQQMLSSLMANGCVLTMTLCHMSMSRKCSAETVKCIFCSTRWSLEHSRSWPGMLKNLAAWSIAWFARPSMERKAVLSAITSVLCVQVSLINQILDTLLQRCRVTD